MKTRTNYRTEYVPHTVGGKTRMVPAQVEVPSAPRDWDQLAINAVTGLVTVLVLVCVVWSTVSIGDLLARVVVEPAAYGAAAVFDLAWIALMIIEWLARFTPARARKARGAGYVALVIAMAAVGTHGWIAGDPAIGIIGAVVSGLAKGTWTILLDYQAAPLDPRTAAFLEQELGEAGAELSRIPVARRVNRARAQLAAEYRALEADGGSADPDSVPDPPKAVPEAPDPNVHPLRGTIVFARNAVQDAWDSGIRDSESVLRYVRNATGKDVPAATVERYLRALRVGA
ncbi:MULTISPECIES: protein transporter Sec31 [unclassified Streptomyces]|uniref:protein transporter Sec31 n=1 Tax=unclassified Streptomyces TaxID=2593676 RepID=UPI003BB72F2D